MTKQDQDKLELKTLDELFTTQDERDDAKREKITDIPLAELHPFKNHPFRVEEDDELRELARSIAEHGVVTPAIARPAPGGGYELISGHRRLAASRLAGRETLPVVVRELDDDAATIIMVDSNQQRENLLPSEKAFSYKMKFEALKHQGKCTSCQVGTKSRTDHEIAEGTDESARTIQRYIRLTNLIPGLLELVDERSIALSPAVELSYLPKKQQEIVLDFCRMQQSTPSFSQAVRLKALNQSGELTDEMLVRVLSEQKANQKDKLVFQKERFAAYFPKGYTAEQMEASILKLLEERRRQIKKARDEAR